VPFRDESFTEDHDETTDHTEISEEKVQVKDETITKALGDDDEEETNDCVFCETFRYDGRGCCQHDKDI